MEWQYECQAGVACPTACSSKGDQIFTTANYASVTIFRLPNRVYWFRIDTGGNMVEFFLESDQLVCSITGAKFKAARAWTSGSPQPRDRQ
jgi:hypothetical protein